ncbi:hypothetical protein [Micromonospora maris]|uniref:hypothetical protein n=1 Tax=Micromonospora maris TaxID=1003110 RepID=UPI002E1130A2|nr:hypothetical protein OG712_04530 [Micromonospora maris]
MFARGLKSVLNLPEQRRFAVMAEGMDRLASSVAILAADAAALAGSRRHQSAAVLRCFADEEAAKILILLDVARAGWKDRTAVEDLLRWFYRHLARGLYVQAYDGRPADLAEVRRYVNGLRAEFYLDGPTGDDWIFRNEIMAGREERLYVDYASDEDGIGRWTGPADRAAMFDEPYRFPAPPSVAVQLVAAMYRIGLVSHAGLEATGKVWQGLTVDDTTHWTQMRPHNVAVVERLAAKGLIPDNEEGWHAARFVCDHWSFPLYSLDLDMEKVAIAELQRARNQRPV